MRIYLFLIIKNKGISKCVSLNVLLYTTRITFVLIYFGIKAFHPQYNNIIHIS